MRVIAVSVARVWVAQFRVVVHRPNIPRKIPTIDAPIAVIAVIGITAEIFSTMFAVERGYGVAVAIVIRRGRWRPHQSYSVESVSIGAGSKLIVV